VDQQLWGPPNLLSLSRMVAAPFIFFLLFLPWRFAAFAATLLFLLASFTDTLDGELARRLHLSSPLGVFLDMTADKVLVAIVTLALVQLHAVPAWMVATILAREFLMMGVRSYAAVQGVIIPAGRWGKGKTAVTVVAITAVLLNLDVQGAGVLTAIDSDRVLAHTLPSLSYWLMLAAVIWTVASGLEYLRGALPLLRSGLRAGAQVKR
jgi:CDP-diacylglycerol--glycerol-3-phosphate 3-phosphatidyltransferase